MTDSHLFTTLAATIATAQEAFAALLGQHVGSSGPSRLQYARYLTMQYHLTKGVQQYFFTAAAHPSLVRRKRLRAFLVHFAQEEELHYLVAAKDLRALGEEIGPCPIDVVLWHDYFGRVTKSSPLVRLGAAAVLENVSAGAAAEAVGRALRAPFLDQGNTRFLVLHRHEILPHGRQILAALAEARLDPPMIRDLEFGARVGLVFYLRMAEWALNVEATSGMADSFLEVSDEERQRIANFREQDLHNAPEIAAQ